MSVPSVRALEARDGASARGLVHAVYAETRHLPRTLELVELALPGTDPECRGLVCVAGDGSLDGVLLYGAIGGAAGVIKVHALAGSDLDSLTTLIGALGSAATAATWRMLVCELSDGSEHAIAATALIARGFAREASVADYFADGISLSVFVLRRPSQVKQPTSTRMAIGA